MPPIAKGRAFGRYEVVRQLGRGAVGEVYLARDPALGRAVAIKVLSGLDGLPEPEQAEARARFLREARAAAALSHPHIVTIHDVGEADGIPFLAMEYLRGTTLDRYAKPGHLLPATKVLAIGIEAARALDEAHRHGIVHRDVKPANLVLLEDGALKVADFGLAKGPESGLTARETLLGTPNYMSPEQIAGEPLDGRSDLFSLAVAIYELLAGQRPFGGDSVSSVLYRIVNDPPRPLLEVRPDLPPQLAALLERTLLKDRDRRPASAGAFAAELSAILASLGGVPAALELPPPAEASGKVKAATDVRGTREAPRTGAGRRTIVIVAALLVCVAAALGLTRSLWMPSVRSITIDVQPAGLALTVAGGAARIEGNVVRIPRDQAQPVTVEIADPCREGRLTLDPSRAPERVPLVSAPRGVPLQVTSTPPGAVVQLDGAPQGTTPATVRAVACRANEIRLTAPGAAKTITLAAGDSPDAWQRSVTAVVLAPVTATATTAREETKPEPKTGKVTISAPPGYAADVRLASGKELGPAGKTYTLPAGANELVFVNPAVHLRHQVTLTVRGGATTAPTIEWPALGALSVYAVPAGGRVLLRPKGSSGAPVELGVTPLNQLPIVAGVYELTIEHPAEEGKIVRKEAAVDGATAVVRVAREDWDR